MKNNHVGSVIAIFLALAMASISSRAQIKTINYLSKANEYLQAGELVEAHKYFEAAHKLNAGSVDVYRGLGNIELLRNDWKKAIKQFSKGVRINQSDLGSLYGLAYCYNQLMDSENAKIYLRKIIHMDEEYEDVWYQYAIALANENRLKRAIEFAEKQIEVRPDLAEPKLGLYRMYGHFIDMFDEDEAIAWLMENSASSYAQFFIAEELRKNNKDDEAALLLEIMLLEPDVFSDQPLYLSLARIYFKEDKDKLAEQYYWQAVDAIECNLDADFIFEDLKYVVSETELKSYRSLSRVDDKKRFFQLFWYARRINLEGDTNSRIADHYDRLLYAEKHFAYSGKRPWVFSPNKFKYLQYPETYHLNTEFNDKGLIYIRHGKPDEWLLAAGASPSNDSWRYSANAKVPAMTFHFSRRTTISNNWQFTAFIESRSWLYQLFDWGNVYYRLFKAGPSERFAYENEMIQQSQYSILVGLNSDK